MKPLRALIAAAIVIACPALGQTDDVTIPAYSPPIDQPYVMHVRKTIDTRFSGNGTMPEGGGVISYSLKHRITILSEETDSSGNRSFTLLWEPDIDEAAAKAALVATETDGQAIFHAQRQFFGVSDLRIVLDANGFPIAVPAADALVAGMWNRTWEAGLTDSEVLSGRLNELKTNPVSIVEALAPEIIDLATGQSATAEQVHAGQGWQTSPQPGMTDDWQVIRVDKAEGIAVLQSNRVFDDDMLRQKFQPLLDDEIARVEAEKGFIAPGAFMDLQTVELHSNHQVTVSLATGMALATHATVMTKTGAMSITVTTDVTITPEDG